MQDMLYRQTLKRFVGLMAETEYTVAVRLTDRNTSITGLFGPAVNFTTLSGIPSRPRNVNADYVNVDQLLRVFWVPPAQPNGTIRRYEVLWSSISNLSSDCDNPGGTVFSTFQSDLQANELSTTNTSNIIGSNSAIVCVRAHTVHPSDWEFVNLVDFVVAPISQECSQEYTAFIIAVVIACLSTFVNLVMGVVLAVVIHQRWSLTRCFSRRGKKGGENGRPRYSTQASTSSTLSRTPLVGLPSLNGDCEKR